MTTIAAGTTQNTGYVATVDSSGNLVFQTNGTTTALTLDTAQNANIVGRVTAAGANIVGNTTITGTLTSNTTIITGNVSVTGTTFANGVVAFANSTSNVFYTAANGNVGIGTSTPNGSLQVVTSSTAGTLKLQAPEGDLWLTSSNATSTYRILASRNTNIKQFRIFDNDNSIDRFYVEANGNIAIGNGVTTYAKLNFDNALGSKIDFYHNTTSSGDRYGVQVQSNELRIHSGAGGDANGGITFGKSTTSTFTENARITNSGYLRVYNQPSFAVYGTTTNFAVDTSVYDVPFNTATFNVGSFFNTSTYTFTAPVAGKYYVSFAFLIYPNSIPTTHYITGWVSKNGSSYLNSLPMARMSFKENQTTMGTDGIVDLAAGDTIKIQVQGSTSGLSIYLNTGHAHFCGYLLG